MGPVQQQSTLGALTPLAIVGALILMALGPFLAGLVIAFGATVAALVVVAIELSRLVHHWRFDRRERAHHAPS
jgi:hypothetical protein